MSPRAGYQTVFQNHSCRVEREQSPKGFCGFHESLLTIRRVQVGGLVILNSSESRNSLKKGTSFSFSRSSRPSTKTVAG